MSDNQKKTLAIIVGGGLLQGLMAYSAATIEAINEGCA
jgi:hypothetical protein